MTNKCHDIGNVYQSITVDVARLTFYGLLCFYGYVDGVDILSSRESKCHFLLFACPCGNSFSVVKDARYGSTCKYNFLNL